MADPATSYLIASTAVNVGMSLFGASKASDAADRAEEAKIRAVKAQYQYDLDVWDMKKQQLQARRQEAVDRVFHQADTEGKIKAYKDVSALEQYDHALRIRDIQQRGNEAAYRRSEDIYTQTKSLNELSAKQAMDSNIVKLQEGQDEIAFDRNDSYLEMLQNEGKLRARGVSGRSAAKAQQATMADYGKQMAMLNATDDSLARNTHAVLEEIVRDKTSADLSAYAARMLKPGELPMPIKPRPLPVANILLPRALQEFDFGPLPIEGAMPAPGVGSDMAWAQGITSIGNAIGSGLSAYAGTLG